MPTTLNKISEQIRRLFYAGNPSDDAELHQTEIKHLVTQELNKQLKVEQLRVNIGLNEYFPSHHLITTYDGVAVSPTLIPTVGIECTPLEGIEVSSVEMTITNLSSDVVYFGIEITGLVISEDDALLIAETIAAASDSCVLSFITENFGPTNFVIGWIEDFSIVGGTLSFNYSPGGLPETGYWLTADGLGWVTGDGYYWQLPDGGTPSSVTVPTAIEDYIEMSSLILEGVSPGDSNTLPFDFSGISICCLVSNELEIEGFVTLPAMPLTLPRGMGIWRVYRPNQPNAPFIPLSSHQMAIASSVSHTNLRSALGALTAYEYINNREIRFNQPASVIGTTVTIQLLVSDFNQDHDSLLPIPADMEQTVIAEVLRLILVNRGVAVDKSNDENDQR